MEKTNDVIIGIDLGTSTTEASIFMDGKSVLIPNREGEKIIPSVVGMDEEGQFVVGSRAKAQLLLRPEDTVMEVKRKMGSGETVKMGKKTYTPQAISAELLSYVRSYASDYLGEEVKRAVISVPAYFNDIQRQATVEAGKLAGLTVERILNEPTAAALSYGIRHLEEESHILVYDLGGGTFDVTLLEMFDGVLEVKASCGDNKLGGKDFDQKIIEFLTGRFFKKHGIRLEKDMYAMVKIREQAEACKIALSSQEQFDVCIPFITSQEGKPLALEETVTVEDFNLMIEALVERTHTPIDTVLADSGLNAEDLDMVLLAGGSTRIPYVKQDIEEYLDIIPTAAVNPDYAVAEGTGIQAGILSGVIDEKDSIIMTDVNPFTLGLRTLSGLDMDYMSVVIPRNVTIPVTRKETYYTSWDGQSQAEIEVYQGERRRASQNSFLGRFTVGGIPPAPAGKESLEVAFSYNQNGMLSVKAVIVSTRKEASIDINMMEKKEQHGGRRDVSGWKQASAAKPYRTVVRRAEKLLGQKAFKEDEPGDWRELEELIYSLKLSILENDENRAEDCEADIEDILDIYLSIY